VQSLHTHGQLATAQGLAQALGVSRTRIYQLMEEPDFPAPVPILGDARVWEVDAVQYWRDCREMDRKHPLSEGSDLGDLA
jgi:predicted DNA-binding transcriptional regulator AlpA